MKMVLVILTGALSLGSSAFASEKVLDRCEGFRPAYFAELVKVEEQGNVNYQINLMGKVTNFTSLSVAQTKFKATCDEVRSWE